MSATAAALELAISFDAGCSDDCRLFAEPLFEQLASGRYDWPASVMRLPDSRAAWELEHGTARKRANLAATRGYCFREIDRREYVEEIFAINTSAPERQGRPMSDGYLVRPSYSPLPDGCPRHRIYTYGVVDARGRLAAYAWVYRVGELVMFSTILGHAERLTDHVMYLLVRDALETQRSIAPGVAFYNRHDSGTEGLRWQKERLGFGPARVRWELG
jgi:hypothetical protein